MISKFRLKIIDFIDNDREYVAITAIASGLYLLIYYYYENFTLLNSLEQFVFFVGFFLVIPLFISVIAAYIFKKVSFLKPFKKYYLAFINYSWFSFLVVIVSIGFKYKHIFLAVFLAFIATFLLYKHLKKIVVFQLLLAVIVLTLLFKFIVIDIVSPIEWTQQPDAIEATNLLHKPNIYLIQPDGYANGEQLAKGYYNFNNSQFDSYLEAHDFTLYNNFRSNYSSTLSSNSSLFSMKHHYYNFTENKIKEIYNARDVIVSDNAVLRILSRHDYKTHLIMSKSYLLINRPQLGYDYCNVNFSEFTYFSRGFHVSKNTLDDFTSIMSNDVSSAQPNFFFIEELSPSHVTNRVNPGNIADEQRAIYLERLKETNEWLIKMIDYIERKDSNALIIIAADHGGFVGMNTTRESREKLTDEYLKQSIFASKLAIKWPKNVPEFKGDIKTTVNLFRILFSSLSEDQSLLDHLQNDKSYIQINKGAPFGVYEYLDENGAAIFNKVEKK